MLLMAIAAIVLSSGVAQIEIEMLDVVRYTHFRLTTAFAIFEWQPSLNLPTLMIAQHTHMNMLVLHFTSRLQQP
jgi:hypothetical protein